MNRSATRAFIVWQGKIGFGGHPPVGKENPPKTASSNLARFPVKSKPQAFKWLKLLTEIPMIRWFSLHYKDKEILWIYIQHNSIHAKHMLGKQPIVRTIIAKHISSVYSVSSALAIGLPPVWLPRRSREYTVATMCNEPKPNRESLWLGLESHLSVYGLCPMLTLRVDIRS